MAPSSLKTAAKVFKIDRVFVNALIIAAVNGLGIMYIKHLNPNKDADRYYHKNEPGKYIIFNMAYTILMLSLAIHTRYVLSHCVANFSTWAKNKWFS